jgi:uncharacterized protein YjdB
MATTARPALGLAVALLVGACSEVAAPSIGRVAFDRDAVTLLAGDVLRTSVTVFKPSGEVVANPPVTYTSSNSQVASVDGDGRVYAHAAGQATISAAVGSITDELTVTVLWPPVTTLVFSRDSIVASIGDTVATQVFALNSKGNWATNATLTYTSSAPSVATVDGNILPGCPVTTCSWEPRIAAVGEGRATITVRAEGLRDTLLVIVTRP